MSIIDGGSTREILWFRLSAGRWNSRTWESIFSSLEIQIDSIVRTDLLRTTRTAELRGRLVDARPLLTIEFATRRERKEKDFLIGLTRDRWLTFSQFGFVEWELLERVEPEQLSERNKAPSSECRQRGKIRRPRIRLHRRPPKRLKRYSVGWDKNWTKVIVLFVNLWIFQFERRVQARRQSTRICWIVFVRGWTVNLRAIWRPFGWSRTRSRAHKKTRLFARWNYSMSAYSVAVEDSTKRSASSAFSTRWLNWSRQKSVGRNSKLSRLSSLSVFRQSHFGQSEEESHRDVVFLDETFVEWSEDQRSLPNAETTVDHHRGSSFCRSDFVEIDVQSTQQINLRWWSREEESSLSWFFSLVELCFSRRTERLSNVCWKVVDPKIWNKPTLWFDRSSNKFVSVLEFVSRINQFSLFVCRGRGEDRETLSSCSRVGEDPQQYSRSLGHVDRIQSVNRFRSRKRNDERRSSRIDQNDSSICLFFFLNKFLHDELEKFRPILFRLASETDEDDQGLGSFSALLSPSNN